MKKSLIKVCAPVLAVCMLAACSSDASESVPAGDGLFDDAVETTVETTVQETEATEKATETTVETDVEEEVLVIGEPSDDSLSVVLINDTDEDITAVALKYDDGEYSDNLLEGTFKTGEERVLYSDIWVKPDDADKFTVKITFASGTEDELHNFDFEAFESASISYDDYQAFIVYEDENGDEVSTFDDEYDIDHPTSTVSAPAPAPAAPAEPVETAAPNADGGCIGDDGLFY